MIYLGNIDTDGMAHVIKGATRALIEEGEIALFIGTNGEAAAYAHHHALFKRHICVHHEALVGVYLVEPGCARLGRRQFNQVTADVKFHVHGLDAQRKAA